MALSGQGCQPSISACDPGCPAQGDAGEARRRRGALMPGEPDAAPPPGRTVGLSPSRSCGVREYAMSVDVTPVIK